MDFLLEKFQTHGSNYSINELTRNVEKVIFFFSYKEEWNTPSCNIVNRHCVFLNNKDKIK